MKIKKRIEKLFQSWPGVIIYILFGFLILYFILGNTNIIFYVLLIIVNIVVYKLGETDIMMYIYLGIVAALLLNKALGLTFLLNTDLPVVAVVSDSMTHDSLTEKNHYQFLEKNLGYSREEIDSWPIKDGFLKGDVLVVKGIPKDDLEVGKVIVFDIQGQNTPIVHRIVKIENDQVTTKGDHNPSYDPWKPKKIHGEAIFVIPYLGWPKLLFTQIFGVG